MSPLCKVCDSSTFSLTAEETGVNVRLSSSRPSQVSTSTALPATGHRHPSQGQLLDWVALDHPFLDLFLYWWTKPSNVLQGMPLQAPVPQLAIYTDASANGLGADCEGQTAASV